MKILVTGGAGFIGSNVVDGYIAAGHEVIVVDNLFTGKKENINPAAKFYKVDIRDKALKEVFEAEQPEVVNHHAAQISVPASVEDPVFDADVNVLGLLNVLECCRKYSTKKIIFISSGGVVYGETDIIPTPEDYPLRPMSPYAITKFISEHYLNFYKHQYGIDFTVLRYANIYGPRQVSHGEAGVVAIFMEKLLNGEVPTVYHYDDEPEGMTRDYCYVKDVVEANLLALKDGSGEVFNIGTGVGTKTEELYRHILALMRQAGYAKDPVYDSPRRGPARAGDLRKSCLSYEKAKKLLGWTPEYDLKTGLTETLKWFLKDKKA
jgi:UDP-glucose 4-epimerase